MGLIRRSVATHVPLRPRASANVKLPRTTCGYQTELLACCRTRDKPSDVMPTYSRAPAGLNPDKPSLPRTSLPCTRRVPHFRVYGDFADESEQGNVLIFGAGMTTTHFTGAGTGFTSRIITSPDGDIAEDKNVTSTGSYSAAAPVTSSKWVMQMVALRAAP